jgi:DmsE family decaheme c-type cytochrome
MLRDTISKGALIALVVALSFVWLPVAAQESGDAEADKEAEAPAYSRRGADGCLRCHDEEEEFPVLGIFRTAHGSRAAENSPFALAQCEGCHGPSGAHERRPRQFPPNLNFGLHEETPVADQNEVCLTCHADEGRMGWVGSAHEEQEVPCASCHQVHVEHDPVASAETQQQVCFDCHQRTRAQTFLASSHPLRFGKMSCSSCHDVHDGHNEYQLVRPSINDTCYTCHAEKRGPFLWEHAPVAEDCSECHNVHGSNHEALLTQRPPLLCQQCHMPGGHPSLALTSESEDSMFESRFLLGSSCSNCHSQVHGSNHPSGVSLNR